MLQRADAGPARSAPRPVAGAIRGALLIAALALTACAPPAPSVRVAAEPPPPPAKVWSPPAGSAAPVLVLSGYSGPDLYEGFAAGLASQGYWVALMDGKDVFAPPHRGEAAFRAGQAAFRRAIAWVRQAPGVRPGKVAVVGYSWGGAATLAHGVALAEDVSVAIVYYPYTAWIGEPDPLARQIRVPTLVLAGVLDRYRECCPIETIRAVDATARALGAPFALIAYPEAGHAFDLGGPTYREEESADAWRRMLAALRQHHSR